MHNINKFLYGLLFISVCSSELTNTTDTVRSEPKNQSVVPVIIQNNVSKLPDRTIAVEGDILPPSLQQDETHLGREHVTNKLSTLPTPFDKFEHKTVVNNTKEKLETESLQEIDSGVSKKNDYTKVVAKKGAPVDNLTPEIKNTSANINVTTVTDATVTKEIISIIPLIPKKPKITEHADDSFIETKNDKSNVHTAKISNFDSVLEKKSKRADYVIPIVAVILSVPLVSIIISVLYKRGTYWWQHRNYRRMDFLIEGMYNN